MRKLAYLATALVSLFAFAMPTMAWFPFPDNDVSVDNTFTSVKNIVTTKAIGSNEIGGMVVSGAKINAGELLSGAQITNTVNFTGLDICGDCVKGDVSVDNKFTGVDNFVTTKVISENEIGGKFVGGFWSTPRITTDMITASTIIGNDINTTIFGDLTAD